MECRVALAFSLKFLSSFHVGTGLGIVGSLDGVVARDGGRNPVIPGSTLKGRMRHHFRQALTLLPGPRSLHPVGSICRPGEPPCPECAVFGAPAHPARFQFPDARPITLAGTEDLLRRVGDTLRTGTCLSRRRGVVQERLLYTIEVAPPDLVFESMLSGWVEAPSPGEAPEAPELIGLLLAARLLEWVGKAKSTGLGRVRATVRSLSVLAGPTLESSDAITRLVQGAMGEHRGASRHDPSA